MDAATRDVFPLFPHPIPSVRFLSEGAAGETLSSCNKADTRDVHALQCVTRDVIIHVGDHRCVWHVADCVQGRKQLKSQRQSYCGQPKNEW